MAWIKDGTACSVQSDLDLCRPRNNVYSPMALKELIWDKVNVPEIIKFAIETVNNIP